MMLPRTAGGCIDVCDAPAPLAAIAVRPAQGRQVNCLLLACVASVLNTAVILMVLAEADLGLRFTALGLL